MNRLELSFVSQRDPGSWAIRWFTHSDFSHVDIITDDGWRLGARSDCPKPYVEPGDPPAWLTPKAGVQVRPMDYAKFSRDERITIPCTRNQYNTSLMWLCQQIGKPYDSSGLFRSFLLDKYQWGDNGKWWCSELAAAFIEAAGFPRMMIPATRCAPNDAFIYAGAMPGATWRKVL